MCCVQIPARKKFVFRSGLVWKEGFGQADLAPSRTELRSPGLVSSSNSLWRRRLWQQDASRHGPIPGSAREQIPFGRIDTRSSRESVASHVGRKDGEARSVEDDSLVSGPRTKRGSSRAVCVRDEL
jgi:hypothetical protein